MASNYTLRDAGDIRRYAEYLDINPLNTSVEILKQKCEEEKARMERYLSFINKFIVQLDVNGSQYIRPFLEQAVRKLELEELGDAEDMVVSGCIECSPQSIPHDS